MSDPTTSAYTAPSTPSPAASASPTLSSPAFPTSDIEGNDSQGKGYSLPVKIANYPFDNRYSDADVALRTPDGTLFYAHKAVLRIASLFFSQMFSLPQPHSPAPAIPIRSPPVIPVSEDPKTLEQILRMCYPVDRPASKVDSLRSTLGAALKYDMPIVTTLLTESLRSHLPHRPLYVFAVAHHLGLQGVGEAAVHTYTAWSRGKVQEGPFGQQATFRRNFPLDEYSSEMDTLSAAVYYRLLEHHTFVLQSSTSSDTDAAVKLITTYPHQSISPRRTEAAVGRLPHPFHDTSHGDIIISSSDNIDFHVDQRLLEFASPQLTQVLSTPDISAHSPDPSGTPHGETDGKPMRYRLPENGRTLAKLFQLCYPMSDPSLDGEDVGEDDGMLKQCIALYEAAKKYGIERAMSFARQACVKATKADPVQLYLLATHFHWDEVAKDAALRAVYATSDTYLAEMEFTPAAAYRRLLLYRRKCRDIILSGGKFAPNQGNSTEPRVPLKRAAYWSKSAWLARPGEAHYWLAFHQRLSSSDTASEPDGRLSIDMEAFLPTSLMSNIDRAAPPIENSVFGAAAPTTSSPADGTRHAELTEIANELVKHTTAAEKQLHVVNSRRSGLLEEDEDEDEDEEDELELEEDQSM